MLRIGVDGRVLEDRYHGIGRITESLLRQFVGLKDIEVVVFLRKDPDVGRVDPMALTRELGHSAAVFDYPLTSVRQFLCWPHTLRSANVDVAIFPYNLGASLFGSARRYSVVHDCIMEGQRTFAPNARTRLLYMVLTAAVVRRTHVLTPSATSALAIERAYRVRVSPEHIIPWGVDTSFGMRLPSKPAIGGVFLPDKYYLHVGARRPHKNVATIVRALSLLPEDEHLVLVGSLDARFRDPVPDIARSLGVNGRLIHFPSVTEEDLLALYAGARAFLYPSLDEGFGLPLLEAMAAGRPVIASDIPVFREVAATAAILVPPLVPKAWADAARALDDPVRRQQLVSEGLRAASDASWPTAAALLLAALGT